MKKYIIKHCSIFLFISILFSANINAGNYYDIMSSTLFANVDVANKLGMTVKGVVVDDSNKPVAGVVVNDGENFTATDASGIYYLPSNLARCKYVRISIPADYEIEKNVVSSFYSKLSNKEDVNRRDFKLKKRKSNSNEFVFLAISDPQVKSKAHLARLDSETIADLKQTIRENRTKNIYAITLGDNVFDEMELFEPYRAMLSSLSVPVFSVIGNHDFDLRYNDLHNTKDSSGNYAEEIYESYFGPADYSFNIGNIHVVAMKNIDYFAGKKYTERFTPEQFEWLKKDLSYVKPGTTVFLNVHAPTSNKSSEGSGNSKNTPELLDILKGYKVHIFSGHTHFYENEEPVAGIYDHNIGAACGAWWAGSVNRCGAPNGYLVVNVKGDDVKWHYKSTGKDNSYQFRIYKPGEFATQADYLVANIWDWDSSYQVKWYEDGKLRGTMEQFDDEDQDFITMKKGKATGYHTLHLFRVKPNKDAKKITVEVKNRFGETFSESVKL